MKVRKEAVILGIMIVVLSLYLIFNQKDRSLYNLPDLDPIPVSEITKLHLASPEGTIIISRKAEEWVLNKERYPGDESKIKRVVEMVANLTLATLISESENYERYELDGSHKIAVKAWKNDALIREFDVGKAASSHRHTFVKLADDHRVYQAGENLRNQFQGGVDQFRNKTVMSFDSKQITQVRIASGDENDTFMKSTSQDVSGEASDDVGAQKSEQAASIWKNAGDNVVDEKKIARLVDEMSSLKCQSFIYGKEKSVFENPIASLALKGDDVYSLLIYDHAEDGDDYPALSSQNEHPFYLPSWRGDKVIKFLSEMGPKDNDQAASLGGGEPK